MKYIKTLDLLSSSVFEFLRHIPFSPCPSLPLISLNKIVEMTWGNVMRVKKEFLSFSSNGIEWKDLDLNSGSTTH